LVVRVLVGLLVLRVITFLVLVGRRRACRRGVPGWLLLPVAAVPVSLRGVFILRRVVAMVVLT
jgi:hypothetical protein